MRLPTTPSRQVRVTGRCTAWIPLNRYFSTTRKQQMLVSRQKNTRAAFGAPRSGGDLTSVPQLMISRKSSCHNLAIDVFQPAALADNGRGYAFIVSEVSGTSSV